MDNTASREGFDIYSGKYVVGKHIPAGDYQVLYVDLPETYYMDDTYDIKIYRSAGGRHEACAVRGIQHHLQAQACRMY